MAARGVDACLHHLIEEQAARTPDNVAATLGGTDVTYRALNEHANHVAAGLQRMGVKPETYVGVSVDRSIECLVSLLGVLKSGGCYVPFASDLPELRISHIADDANIEIITGSAKALAGFSGINLLPAEGLMAAEAVRSPVRPDNVAYTIFTSGSTGVPKGVVTPHRQIVNSTLARFPVFPRPCSSYLMLAPFTFDAAAAGIYFTLSSGGRLVVPTAEEARDPALLAELIINERITHVDGVPSQYAALVTFHPEVLRGLRCTILAGEALHVSLVQSHFAAAPDAELFNEYGPTEGTVWSAVHRCSRQDAGSFAPIGRPIENVRVHLLDENLDEIPPGEIGEICIAGAGLARGYLNQPAMTAERFLPNPYSDRPGRRLYRSGDLGRINERGDLVFCGRADQQVKVRGYRVEPGEVEVALMAHLSVRAAAVVAFQSSTGTRLAGFVALVDGDRLTESELAEFLSARLPEYMIPGRWQVVSELPLTSHGKVDRRLLVHWTSRLARSYGQFGR
jgi:amino acid adenylation domain-containing protein